MSRNGTADGVAGSRSTRNAALITLTSMCLHNQDEEQQDQNPSKGLAGASEEAHAKNDNTNGRHSQCAGL